MASQRRLGHDERVPVVVGEVRWVSIALATLVVASSLETRAQDRAGAVDRASGECVALEVECEGDVDCAASPTASTCATYTIAGATLRSCMPASAPFCCAEGISCPDGSRCLTGAIGTDLGLCVRDTDDYCGPIAATEQLRSCHTSPAGAALVAYADGDCDQDGVDNAAELAATTDPCTAPPGAHGVLVGDGTGNAACLSGVTTCEGVDAPCRLEGDERARCAHNERTGGAAPLCSVEPDLFCCGGIEGLHCPAGECVLPSDDEGHFGVCTDPSLLCADRTVEALTQCHRGVDGRGPVPVEDGDCDGDGVSNERERELGSDHCSAGDVDAGTALDAGGSDAGPGPALEVSFAGGGGCRCAIGSRDAPRLAIFFVIAVGLAAALRRR